MAAKNMLCTQIQIPEYVVFFASMKMVQTLTRKLVFPLIRKQNWMISVVQPALFQTVLFHFPTSKLKVQVRLFKGDQWLVGFTDTERSKEHLHCS